MTPEEQALMMAESKGVSESKILVNECSFYLVEIPINVTLKVYYCSYLPNSAKYEFSLSHHIKTPEQAGVYLPSAPFCESIKGAVNRGISSLT
jgi:hypothetical protein